MAHSQCPFPKIWSTCHHWLDPMQHLEHLGLILDTAQDCSLPIEGVLILQAHVWSLHPQKLPVLILQNLSIPGHACLPLSWWLSSPGLDSVKSFLPYDASYYRLSQFCKAVERGHSSDLRDTRTPNLYSTLWKTHCGHFQTERRSL